MSLKWRYFLFIGFIHVVIALLSYQLLRDQKLWFIAAEVLMLGSLVLSYSLYRSLIKPLQFLSSGIDAIADKDFAIRFRDTGSREMNRLIHVYNKMMDNIRDERAQVQEQHYFLEKLIHASPAGIILLDYDDNIADINPQAMQMLGMQRSVIGEKLACQKHPILEEIATWQAGRSGVVYGNGQEQFKCEVSHFVHRGFRRKFMLFQELSREILAAEKRAYGKVIRMMAHEVNNSMGAINSILQSTIDAYPDHEEDDLADDIRQSLQIAIDRNRRLNGFMQNFAKVVRLPEASLKPRSLQQLLRNVHHLMAPQAQTQDTDLQLRLPTEDRTHLIDEKLIEQALVNMVKNALESLEKGGVIKIRFDKQPFQIVVADNGPGINPADQANLMTPFFSTKPEGQGIGLTLIREIADQHHAFLQLETLPSGWTESRLVFRNK
jgi:two-component system, NtrC family, nitrogen regulation sensor histidine kinase NtrY